MRATLDDPPIHIRPTCSRNRRENYFIEGSDFSAISRLGTEFNRSDTTARLRQLCERWIYSVCLCFALSNEERNRCRFQYQYSVFQLELSRNLLFWRGTTMNEVFQKLVDRTRAPLVLNQVKTIYCFSYRPHQIIKRGRERTEVSKAVQAKSYDLTVFKIKWGNLTLKIYDKGGRVLRIEVSWSTMPKNCVAARCWIGCRPYLPACRTCWYASLIPSRPLISAF